jgi:hypothetical protein
VSFQGKTGFWGMVQKKVTLLCHCEEVAQPHFSRAIYGAYFRVAGNAAKMPDESQFR